MKHHVTTFEFTLVMGKINRTTKENMKALLERGLGHRDISRKLKVSKSTVSKFAKKKGFESNPKKGRPKLLSERDENFCAKEVASGRIETAVKLSKVLKQRFDISASPDTISRVLKRKGFKASEKKKKPFLSPKNTKARLDFAKAHQDWTLDDWKRVIFSDETKINRFNSDGRTWFWSKDSSILNERSVKPTLKHGGGGIMIWGCMTAQGVGYCCKIDSTMDSTCIKTF